MFLIFLGQIYLDRQCRPRSDCSFKSGLFRVSTVYHPSVTFLEFHNKNNNNIIIMIIIITFTTLCAYSADDKLVIFFLFSRKTGFDISCNLSPLEKICMKCQNLFSGKIRKYLKMSSAENLTQSAKR